MKTINPYQRLLDDVKKFCLKVQHPKTIDIGWFYSKKVLENGDGYALLDLYYHVQAGGKLGYDTVLKADKDGLHVFYTEKRPQIPYRWQ